MSAEYTEITLEKISFYVAQTIPQDILLNQKIRITEWYTDTGKHLVMMMTGHVLGETVDTFIREWPSDWWEAFKDRWFPEWALRRWPVVYTELKVDAKAIYGRLHVQLPKEQHKIILMNRGVNR